MPSRPQSQGEAIPMSEATPNPAPPPPPTPAAKPAPAKPAAKPAGKTRRFFLLSFVGSWIAVGWTTMTASLVGMTLGTVRFLFPNVSSEPPSQIKVKPENWPADGQVVDSF